MYTWPSHTREVNHLIECKTRTPREWKYWNEKIKKIEIKTHPQSTQIFLHNQYHHHRLYWVALHDNDWRFFLFTRIWSAISRTIDFRFSAEQWPIWSSPLFFYSLVSWFFLASRLLNRYNILYTDWWWLGRKLVNYENHRVIIWFDLIWFEWSRIYGMIK